MTKLLEQAVEQLVHLPEPEQDREARAILARLARVPVQAEAQPSLLALVGAGSGVYGSADAIDAYVRAERDAWDS